MSIISHLPQFPYLLRSFSTTALENSQNWQERYLGVNILTITHISKRFSRPAGQFETCPHVLNTSIILGVYFAEICTILENFQFERMCRTFQEFSYVCKLNAWTGVIFLKPPFFQEYIILNLS